jgi:hypothetical protein
MPGGSDGTSVEGLEVKKTKHELILITVYKLQQRSVAKNCLIFLK